MLAMSNQIQLEASWKHCLSAEIEQPYMQTLLSFLASERAAGKTIYPETYQYFAALNAISFDKVKVVILGQDPYHGEGQAHGLCFSVPPQTPPPPSLLNIFKALNADLGIPRPEHGCLLSWANQGVLLLNSVLTVQANQAASHQGKGWERFTDKIIHVLSEEREHIVFILWGSYAQKKGKVIDQSKHLVLKGVHPSPLSAYRGFFGGKFFSQANDYFEKTSSGKIDWSLPNRSVAIEQFKQASGSKH